MNPKIPKGFIKGLLLVWLSFASLEAAPCITAGPACSEWIHLEGSSRSLIYRTYPIDQRNENITRALVIVHGAGRDADNYFRTALAAAFLAGAMENTVVIAPRFASDNGSGCHDSLAEDEVNWSCNGDSWRSGGVSTNNPKLTSYDFMDDILRELASRKAFSNLSSIVVAGHSAGGQFVTRYEMANRVHDKLGVPVQYVVANPSSYAYLDPLRPDTDGSFKAFHDAHNCTTYDNWPYGLKNRTGYTAKLEDTELKAQLVARPVTYLLGEIDILPLGGFDSSCPAMAQGPTRLARGLAFQKDVSERYQAPHQIVTVPLCGHNARCMFTSETALPILFLKR